MLLRMSVLNSQRTVSTARFIHEQITEYVHGFVRDIRARYHLGEVLEPLLVAWPRTPTKDNAGSWITHAAIMELKEEDMSRLPVVMLKVAERVGAYALLLFSVTPEELKVVLETPSGTETWRMERQKRGDVFFLKEAKKSSDEKGFDILWRRDSQTSLSMGG